MSENVKPALTPEEWEVQQTLRPGFPGAIAYGTDVTVGEGFDSVSFSGEARHALAALALHGQPFGFTREDVKLLRAVADPARIGPMGRNPRLLALAARIAALLPPEDA